MPTTSLASTSVQRDASAPASSGRTTSPRPTMSSRRSGNAARTSRAAGTATAAPWSPLMASTAIVSPAVMRGRDRGLFLAFLGHRLLDDLLAAVETVRRDAMTQVRLAAGAVDRQRGALQGIVRPAHATRGGCLAALLNCHGLV